MRVVLLGSSRPAVVALRTLQELGVDIVGVGAHVGESIGAVGESVLDAARRDGLRTVEFDAGDRPGILRFVSDVKPQLGFTVGFRYLLDPATVRAPALGWLNIHSSLLPNYRGRAPVNWAILGGETELGATLHVIDEGVDTGDIVFQERFGLEDTEDVSDALAHLEVAYRELIRKSIAAVRAGQLPRTPMPDGNGKLWPRRTEDDGRIDWTRPATDVVRLIRAVAPPYPGAFTLVGGRRLYIRKARVGTPLDRPSPGLIASEAAIHAADAVVEPLVVAFDDLGSLAPRAALAALVGAVCD